MAIKGNASGQRTGRWEVLLSNLRPSLPDMPHLADDFKALETLLPQARTLQTQREDLRSQAAVLSKQHLEALDEGDKIRARMGSALKAKFGFSDAILSKYGFRPFTGRRHKSPDSTPPPTVEGPAKPVAAAPGTSPAAAAKGAK